MEGRSQSRRDPSAVLRASDSSTDPIHLKSSSRVLKMRTANGTPPTLFHTQQRSSRVDGTDFLVAEVRTDRAAPAAFLAVDRVDVPRFFLRLRGVYPCLCTRWYHRPDAPANLCPHLRHVTLPPAFFNFTMLVVRTVSTT